MRKTIISVLNLILICLSFSVGLGADVRPEWKAFGEKYKNRYPGDDTKKAVFLSGVVGEALFQMKIDPNYDLLGRARASRKHGNQSAGTCGDIAEILRNVFEGAGFKRHQMFKILVKKEGLDAVKQGWIFDYNLEHAVFGVIVNGKPVVFDAWAYGGDNGSFGDFYKSIWNGMDLSVWLKTMQNHNYSSYSYGDPNFKTIDVDDIYLLLGKIELQGSGRLQKKPQRIQDDSVDGISRVEAEFRALYPKWLNATKGPGARIVVTANAVKVGPNKYRVASEIRRIAEHGTLKGKEYTSGSIDNFMTFGELKAAVKFYKKELGIK